MFHLRAEATCASHIFLNDKYWREREKERERERKKERVRPRRIHSGHLIFETARNDSLPRFRKKMTFVVGTVILSG